MRIGLLNIWSGGVAHYRQWQQARALERLGHDVVWFPDPKKRPFEMATSTGEEAVKELIEKMATSCDIIHSSYTPRPVQTEMLVGMRHVGNIPIVYDIDDDYYNVPDYNGAYRAYHLGTTGGFEAIRLGLRISDVVTVSTLPLMETCKQDARKIALCPNYHDTLLWDSIRLKPLKRHNDEVWMMFLGGMGRIGDLNAIEAPITTIMEKYENVRLFFVGSMPHWAIKWMNSASDPKKNRAVMVQFSMFERCAALLTHIAPDIMLAPVIQNEFNRSKSHIKAYEAAEAGATLICSDWDTYADVPDDACVRVSSDAAWVDGMSELIENATLRKQLHSKCLTWTREEMNIDKHIHKWLELYQETIEKGPVRSLEELREGVEAWQTKPSQLDGPLPSQ